MSTKSLLYYQLLLLFKPCFRPCKCAHVLTFVKRHFVQVIEYVGIAFTLEAFLPHRQIFLFGLSVPEVLSVFRRCFIHSLIQQTSNGSLSMGSFIVEHHPMAHAKSTGCLC